MVFSTDNTYGKQTTDLERVDDTRSFTSEALFVESASRLNRSLTNNELKDIIRASTEFQSLNSLYFTPEKGWPTINQFYLYRKLNQFQITNFYEPDNFNDVKINQYGVALQYCYPSEDCDSDKSVQNNTQDTKSQFTFDRFFIRGVSSRVRSKGIIEFLPNKNKNINEFVTIRLFYINYTTRHYHYFLTMFIMVSIKI